MNLIFFLIRFILNSVEEEYCEFKVSSPLTIVPSRVECLGCCDFFITKRILEHKKCKYYLPRNENEEKLRVYGHIIDSPILVCHICYTEVKIKIHLQQMKFLYMPYINEHIQVFCYDEQLERIAFAQSPDKKHKYLLGMNPLNEKILYFQVKNYWPKYNFGNYVIFTPLKFEDAVVPNVILDVQVGDPLGFVYYTKLRAPQKESWRGWIFRQFRHLIRSGDYKSFKDLYYKELTTNVQYRYIIRVAKPIKAPTDPITENPIQPNMKEVTSYNKTLIVKKSNRLPMKIITVSIVALLLTVIIVFYTKWLLRQGL